MKRTVTVGLGVAALLGGIAAALPSANAAESPNPGAKGMVTNLGSNLPRVEDPTGQGYLLMPGQTSGAFLHDADSFCTVAT